MNPKVSKQHVDHPAVLVASCDKYADLWRPFFQIFWQHWPDCPFPVYLGSNRYSLDDSRVNAIQIDDDLDWATGLQRMLDRIVSEYVILSLEDFFIEECVDTIKISRLARIAREQNVGCLRLAAGLPLALPPTRPIAQFPGLGSIDPGDIYRVTTQIAIWHAPTLRRLLVPGMNIWQFESLGTKMSHNMPDRFWGVYAPAIVYDHAVEKGKWKPKGLRLCERLGVKVDRSRRSVFSDSGLQDHYTASAPSKSEFHKRLALAEFQKGRRGTGMRYCLRGLRSNPLALAHWSLMASGLCGPQSLRWLERLHLSWELAMLRLRNRCTARYHLKTAPRGGDVHSTNR